MQIKELTTESRNPNSLQIDEVSTLEMVQIMNAEDQKVAEAVAKELPQIAAAIDAMSERFNKGGRIIYTGAGTSGRLGALDAIELTPTYSIPATRTFGLLAGGVEAMYVAVEGAEDSKELAIEDLSKVELSADDILISIAASGRTPYAISALEYANKVGALSISVTCNAGSEMAAIAQHSIAVTVGPEVVTGSTRMKAGTAQKMVLNMLSTGTMIRGGKVYSNLMINVQPTNEKLRIRTVNIVMDATGLSTEDAAALLEDAGQSIPVAIVMHATDATQQAAVDTLEQVNGLVGKAIKLLNQ